MRTNCKRMPAKGLMTSDNTVKIEATRRKIVVARSLSLTLTSSSRPRLLMYRTAAKLLSHRDLRIAMPPDFGASAAESGKGRFFKCKGGIAGFSSLATRSGFLSVSFNDGFFSPCDDWEGSGVAGLESSGISVFLKETM